MSTMPRNDWLPGAGPAPDSTLRLFCFPHAGGAASLFRSWTQDPPPGLAVCPVQLPGRESRFGQPFATGITDLVPDLAAALRPWLDVPFALLGNSMGALIAFELARHLRREAGPEPVRLIVGGAEAPGAERHWPRLSDLPDVLFGRAMQERHGGIPDLILTDPQLRAIYLPLLRADMGLVEDYRLTPGPMLSCPVSAYVGAADHSVRRSEVDGWGAVTSGPFDAAVIDGDHFAIVEHRDLIIGRLLGDVAVR
jgi:surfactin synthase thioesterase subunit